MWKNKARTEDRRKTKGVQERKGATWKPHPPEHTAVWQGEVEAASEDTHTLTGRQAFRVLGPGRTTERHRELMGSPGTERAGASRGPTIKVLITRGFCEGFS